MNGGHGRAALLAEPDGRQGQQHNHGYGGSSPAHPHPAKACDTGQGRDAELPLAGDGVDKPGRRAEPLWSIAPRRLDRVVQGSRVLAPEGVSCRGWCVAGLELRSTRAGGGSDWDKLLGRAEPVARKTYDVLLVASCPTGVFVCTVARSQGLQTFLTSGCPSVSLAR